MLSENQVVRHRRAIESTYNGRCSVIESRKIKNANRSTGFEEVVVYEDVPCKLSYKVSNQGIGIVRSSDDVNFVKQHVKIFVAPEIKIDSNSKIIVRQNGIEREYKNSSEPVVFSTHQEIELRLGKEFC